MQFYFTQTNIGAAGRDVQTSSLVSYRSRLQHQHLQHCQTRRSRKTVGCPLTAFVLFDTYGELGNGLGDDKIKEPQFFKNVCMVLKEFI